MRNTPKARAITNLLNAMERQEGITRRPRHEYQAKWACGHTGIFTALYQVKAVAKLQCPKCRKEG